jgi:serine phosphatase RsbU (regulator of sigma subunit)
MIQNFKSGFATCTILSMVFSIIPVSSLSYDFYSYLKLNNDLTIRIVIDFIYSLFKY